MSSCLTRRLGGVQRYELGAVSGVATAAARDTHAFALCSSGGGSSSSPGNAQPLLTPRLFPGRLLPRRRGTAILQHVANTRGVSGDSRKPGTRIAVRPWVGWRQLTGPGLTAPRREECRPFAVSQWLAACAHCRLSNLWWLRHCGGHLGRSGSPSRRGGWGRYKCGGDSSSPLLA